MNVVSIREVMPHLGKEELAESRIRKASEILSKHGAQTRLWKVAAGQDVTTFVLMSMYETFSKGAVAFQNFSADPDMMALMKERSANPSGDIRGPNVYRMAYGAPTSAPRPILVQRFYQMPRKNMASALALAPELDQLMQGQDVSIGVGVPIVADDHEMMGIVYRFKSMEHWGNALDAMVENQKFSSLVEKANSLGTLKSSRMLVSI